MGGRLPRLKAVIQETLRLYPPVWMFDRRAVGPDDLAGTRVAEGDLVIFCPYALHRLPPLWTHPESFRPERFEPGREEQKNKFAYLPFSTGPPHLPGREFRHDRVADHRGHHPRAAPSAAGRSGTGRAAATGHAPNLASGGAPARAGTARLSGPGLLSHGRGAAGSARRAGARRPSVPGRGRRRGFHRLDVE
ncbi:MAG: cytochrome P450 [Planctomycetes bacterium]|nr:cytochrome P450 [Planctomycetota bacterium]